MRGGSWEPYRIDESVLNRVLAWIVTNTDRTPPVDVGREVDEAVIFSQAVSEEGIRETIERLRRKLGSLRHSHEYEVAWRSLPPGQARVLLESLAATEQIIALSHSDVREARIAARLEAAEARGEASAPLIAWAEDQAITRDDGRMVAEFLLAFGPLLAGPYHEQRFEMCVVDGATTPVPVPPPLSANMSEAVDELRQIRSGILLLHAIQNADMPSIEEAASNIRRASTMGIAVPSIRIMAEDDARMHGTPDGELGFALKWFSFMATRWPFQVWPDMPSGGLLLPVPVGPAQLIWMVLAHNAGALRLPFDRADNLSVRFCAEPSCGKPIFSTRPRKRGEHWFCDSLTEGKHASCANRFHSREWRRRNAEARLRGTKSGGDS